MSELQQIAWLKNSKLFQKTRVVVTKYVGSIVHYTIEIESFPTRTEAEEYAFAWAETHNETVLKNVANPLYMNSYMVATYLEEKEKGFLETMANLTEFKEGP